MRFLKIVLIAASFYGLYSCEDSLTEEKRVANELTIQNYLTNNNIAFVKHDGVFVTLLHKGYGYQIVPGDSVGFWYVGRTLTGNIFDTNIREVADEVGINPEARKFEPVEIIAGSDNLLPGLSRGIPLCRQWQWNSIYFPSTLGYGDDQAGSVAPWTPLVFDIYIIYVKNEKIIREQNNINNFVAGMQGFTPDTTGMWTKYTAQGSALESPESNDTIFGWYRISTLDFKPLFEVEGENDEIVLNNQLIEGVELGFLRLKPGEAMQMVVPSPLAYGSEGNDNVLPYTPLFCEIRLDSIK